MVLSEEVRLMILSALESMEVTSANPTHINRLIQVTNIDPSNLDQTLREEIERIIKELGITPEKIDKEEIRKEVDKIVKDIEKSRPKEKQDKNELKKEVKKIVDELDAEKPKKKDPLEQAREDKTPVKLPKLKDDDKEEKLKIKKDIKNHKLQFKRLDEGNVGDITRMTNQQFGNIKSFAQNPIGFITSTFFRKFAKGAGVLLLATLIFQAVQFIINELLKPGRLLDRRFKRNIDEEIMAFRRREEKQKLAQGFSRLIITSMPRLRGGQDQVVDTFRMIQNNEPVFPNGTFMVEEPKGTGISITSKGRGRSTRRFAR